jgi:uncharacterized membrane protein YdjX (TVP38/TMEM64 family)
LIQKNDQESTELKNVEDPKQIKRRKIISAISILSIIAFFVIITIVVGEPLLNFVADSEKFRGWVDSQGFWGRLTLIGIMCLQVVVAIIPGEVIEIGAGYAFGAVEGMLLCLIGAAIGSAVIFAFTKRFGIKLVEAFIPREKINSLQFVKDSKKLDLLIFILFFIPGTPKDVITYFIGLTPMKLHTFLIISSIARVPSVISSTIGGNAIGMQDYRFAVIVFAITAGISIVGIIIYNKILKHNKKNSEQNDIQSIEEE